MGTVYSHSRLSSFENCPRQFHYRYVERRVVDTEGIEAFVGKRVHEVLERLNQFLERGLVPSLAKVVGRFRAEWEKHFDPARVRIVRAENPPEAYRENGERCLANHYRRHYPFDRDETLGIEAHLSFPLDAEGRYRLQGFVDRLARAPDGAIEIHDYKTGRWVPSQQDLDQDRQLALYQIGVHARHGADTPVRLVWHYLLRDQVRTSTRSADQLAALRTRTIDLIDRIEAEQDFAPKPGNLCDWCEHNDVCPAMQARKAPQAPRSEPQASEVDRDAGASAATTTPEAPLAEAACGGTALASAAAGPAAAERAARKRAQRARSEPQASEVHQDGSRAAPIRPPAHEQVRREEGLDGDPGVNHRVPLETPTQLRLL